ncbi:binary toxin-like calcium binding domain-containing protein [Lactococcus garvieae]|uniref:binary toxin-like calcium binding domain-containing protein n=1 Tax=Lactococcus garvieae TaxID=1363 RepID=UPI00398E5285
MKNKALKIIAIAGISCVSIMLAEVITYADQNSQIKIGESNVQDKETHRNGLMGYYYEDTLFSKPVVVAPAIDNLGFRETELVTSDQSFQSIRWLGYIVSDTTKDVILKLSNEDYFKIKVNDKEQSNIIHLEKNKPLSLQIEYKSSKKLNSKQLSDLQLLVINKANNNNETSKVEFKNPQFGNKSWEESISNSSRMNLYTKTTRDDELIDTDGDNIYDQWELEGYTIQNKVAVAWKDEFEEKGYTKFKSNPLEAHTAGDPYNDYEKAARDVPLVNGKETFNPLVAAFPSVNVNLEKVILSKNEDLSHSVGSNHSTNWSYTNTEGVDVNAGWSLFGPSFGISGHYQHSETVAQEWGGSEEDSSHLNGAESGYLNANVRYNNVGTGAIYYVKPTTSFVLGDTTIGTIKAKENTEALSISPNESYPKKGKNGIAINTMDDFNSRPIPLNKEQLNTYLKNKAPIVLETDQVDGKYASKDIHGNIVIEGDWNGVQQQINARTASIMIDAGDTITEKKIAGKDYSNAEDKTPEVTLKEALLLAYPEDITDKNGILEYKGIPLEEYSVLSYVDEYTSKLIQKQLSDKTGIFKDVHNLYDVKLEPKMAITIKQSLIYDNMEETRPMLGEWSKGKYITDINNSNSGIHSYWGAVEREGDREPLFVRFNEETKNKFKENCTYYITMSIKEDKDFPLGKDKGVTVRAIDEFSEMGVGMVRTTLDPNGYKRVTVIAKVDKGDKLGGFALSFMSVAGPKLPKKEAIYIDDISIAQVGVH